MIVSSPTLTHHLDHSHGLKPLQAQVLITSREFLKFQVASLVLVGGHQVQA